MTGRSKNTWPDLIRSLIPDVLAVAGAFFIGFGAWVIYPPAGWIVAGAELIAGAVIWSKGGAK